MASFEAKIGWKRMRERERKNYCSVPFLPEAQQKIPKKQQINLKNTIMASFQAKIDWESPRQRENKNCRSIPTRRVIDNSIKIAKKFKKFENNHYGFISNQNRLEKAEKERKQKLFFHFVHSQRVIENTKKIEKNSRK